MHGWKTPKRARKLTMSAAYVRGRMRSGALLLLLVLLIVVPFVVVEKVSLGVEGDECAEDAEVEYESESGMRLGGDSAARVSDDVAGVSAGSSMEHGGLQIFTLMVAL